MQLQTIQPTLVLPENLAPYQQIALEAMNEDLSMNDRMNLLSVSVLAGGHTTDDRLEQLTTEVTSLRSRLSTFQEKDRKRISAILDKAIAEYQRRGAGSLAGGSLGIAGVITSAVFFPILAVPAYLASANILCAAGETADREFEFEQKLRKLKEEKHFENSGIDSDELEDEIFRLKEEHNIEFAKRLAAKEEARLKALPPSTEVGTPYPF